MNIVKSDKGMSHFLGSMDFPRDINAPFSTFARDEERKLAPTLPVRD